MSDNDPPVGDDQDRPVDVNQGQSQDDVDANPYGEPQQDDMDANPYGDDAVSIGGQSVNPYESNPYDSNDVGESNPYASAAGGTSAVNPYAVEDPAANNADQSLDPNEADSMRQNDPNAISKFRSLNNDLNNDSQLSEAGSSVIGGGLEVGSAVGSTAVGINPLGKAAAPSIGDLYLQMQNASNNKENNVSSKLPEHAPLGNNMNVLNPNPTTRAFGNVLDPNVDSQGKSSNSLNPSVNSLNPSNDGSQNYRGVASNLSGYNALDITKDDEVENLTPSEMYNAFKTLWRNEKYAPELLTYPEKFVTRIWDELEAQTEQAREWVVSCATGENHDVGRIPTDDDRLMRNGEATLLLEIHRWKFLVKDYLRIRLAKIDFYAAYYATFFANQLIDDHIHVVDDQKNPVVVDDQKNPPDGEIHNEVKNKVQLNEDENLLNHREKVYAKKVWAIEKKRFEQDVMEYLPTIHPAEFNSLTETRKGDADIIRRPNLNKSVFVEVLEDIIVIKGKPGRSKSSGTKNGDGSGGRVGADGRLAGSGGQAGRLGTDGRVSGGRISGSDNRNPETAKLLKGRRCLIKYAWISEHLKNGKVKLM